jgi:predicted nucleic acid-binding Zn ribbon protein
MTDYARYCPECNLVYIPDSRIYDDPDTFCPKCGARLVEEDDESEE